MPGVARVHRNSRRAQSGAGAAADPAKAHRTRPPDRAQAAPSTPPPKDAAVKTGPHFSETIRLTLMGHRAAMSAPRPAAQLPRLSTVVQIFVPPANTRPGDRAGRRP